MNIEITELEQSLTNKENYWAKIKMGDNIYTAYLFNEKRDETKTSTRQNENNQ